MRALRTLLVGTALFIALAFGIVAHATPAASSGSDAAPICRPATIRLLFDVSSSVNAAERRRLLAAVDLIAAATQSCPAPPSVSLYAFTNVAWGAVPLYDASEQIKQLIERTPFASNGWTDPVAAAQNLASGGDVMTIVIFDGLVEPGHDGPPADPSGYVAAVHSLSTPRSAVFLWGIAQRGDDRYTAFKALWGELERTDLGELAVVSGPEELSLPAVLQATNNGGVAVHLTPTVSPDASTAMRLPGATSIDALAPGTVPGTAAGAGNGPVVLVGGLLTFIAAALVLVLARRSTAAPASPRPVDIAVFSAERAPSLHRLRPGKAEAQALIGTDGRVEFRDSELVVRTGTLETVVPLDGRPVQVGDSVIRKVLPFTSPLEGVRLPSLHATSEEPPDKGFYA